MGLRSLLSAAGAVADNAIITLLVVTVVKPADDLLSNQMDENELKFFSIMTSLLLAFIMLSWVEKKRMVWLVGGNFP